MQFNTTDQPSAKVEDERVVIEVPSGSTIITICLSPHQAMHLSRAASLAAAQAMDDSRASAEVIPFQRRSA